MFDYLYEWIQNIAFYMILSTVFFEALPVNSYKKYIRFFTGMVLVLLLIGPVLKVFGMRNSFSDIFDSGAYEKEMERIEETTEYLWEVDVEDYIKEVEGTTSGTKERMEDTVQ